MSESTKDYFEREKESRFKLADYLDTLSESVERIEKARDILWDEIETFIEYEKDEDTWEEYIDEYNTDRDSIDDAIRNYYDLLSIEKRVKVNPYDNIIEDKDDAKYKLMITRGWPNVFRDIDWTAELHLYWWGDHFTRDFGSDFANMLLSFYWLE